MRENYWKLLAQNKRESFLSLNGCERSVAVVSSRNGWGWAWKISCEKWGESISGTSWKETQLKWGFPPFFATQVSAMLPWCLWCLWCLCHACDACDAVVSKRDSHHVLPSTPSVIIVDLLSHLSICLTLLQLQLCRKWMRWCERSRQPSEKVSASSPLFFLLFSLFFPFCSVKRGTGADDSKMTATKDEDAGKRWKYDEGLPSMERRKRCYATHWLYFS